MVIFLSLFWNLFLEKNEGDADDEQKKGRQKRGGKALMKPKKKESGEKIVKICRANRGKKKFVTCLFIHTHTSISNQTNLVLF